MLIPRKGSRISLPTVSVVWPKGALEQTINISLPRGVLIHGRVTEEGSGNPVPGALVDFEIRRELERQVIITGPCTSTPSLMALFVSAPSPNRATSLSGVRTMITCSRPLIPGSFCEAGQAAAGCTRTPTPRSI